MGTQFSSNTAYCTGEEFCNYFDWHTAAMYLFESADWSLQSAHQTAYPDRASVESDATLEELLKAASGKVEAAALAGKRYTVTDLEALDGNTKKLLVELVANLAAVSLVRRRPNMDLPPLAISQEVNMFLEALATGQRIFGVEETADAGYMHTVTETYQDVENRNLPTFIARRYFGIRANRDKAIED